MVTLQMYVCFSFQDTEFNSLLFEYELALITCLSNRMQQTCFGNSEARSLKQCVLFVCVNLGMFPPRTRLWCGEKSNPHGETRQGHFGWQHKLTSQLTLTISYPARKGKSLLDVQPSQALRRLHPEQPSSWNSKRDSKSTPSWEKTFFRTVRSNNKLLYKATEF